MMQSLNFIVYNRPIGRVAFYDRASTRAQETNYARFGHCSSAAHFAVFNGLSFIASGDKRNLGICFLDVGTGIESNNRPEFLRALNDGRIDTIIAMHFDRLARGVDSFRDMAEIVNSAGKNLSYIVDLEEQMRLHHIISAIGTMANPQAQMVMESGWVPLT